MNIFKKLKKPLTDEDEDLASNPKLTSSTPTSSTSAPSNAPTVDNIPSVARISVGGKKSSGPSAAELARYGTSVGSVLPMNSVDLVGKVASQPEAGAMSPAPTPQQADEDGSIAGGLKRITPTQSGTASRQLERDDDGVASVEQAGATVKAEVFGYIVS